MLIFYEIEQDGEPVLKYYSVNSANAPFAVKTPANRPGVDKPFWAFPTVSNPSQIVTWSFQDAPIVSSSAAANAAAIAAITATPAEVFTWPEEEPAE